MYGKLIVFEGVDGSGKTTQARLLYKRLDAAGLNPMYTREPTDGPYGTQIRALARNSALTPEVSMDLFIRDRREHVETKMIPALRDGRIVVCDRHWWSTAAYQSETLEDVDYIESLHIGWVPTPFLIVLMDADPVETMVRIRSREAVAEDINTFDNVKFLQKCRVHYAHLSRNCPDLLLIDGGGRAEDIHETIASHVMRVL